VGCDVAAAVAVVFAIRHPLQRNLIKSSSIKRSSVGFSFAFSFLSFSLFLQSLINAFNVFNQATGKRLRVAGGLRGSSNSLKHFTYLHINWLKRKYIQGNQHTLTHSLFHPSFSMCQRSKGRKGPLVSFPVCVCVCVCICVCLVLDSISLSVSVSDWLRIWLFLYFFSPLFPCLFSFFFFGYFWHFKCVWLFPFDQRIVNWFTDWVQVQLMRQQRQHTQENTSLSMPHWRNRRWTIGLHIHIHTFAYIWSTVFTIYYRLWLTFQEFLCNTLTLTSMWNGDLINGVSIINGNQSSFPILILKHLDISMDDQMDNIQFKFIFIY